MDSIQLAVMRQKKIVSEKEILYERDTSHTTASPNTGNRGWLATRVAKINL